MQEIPIVLSFEFRDPTLNIVGFEKQKVNPRIKTLFLLYKQYLVLT